MKLSFVKDLNLFKLAGNKDIIILDIVSDSARILLVRRKEKFLKVKNGDIHKNIQIVQSQDCLLDNEFLSIKKEIKALITNHGLKNPLIIAGLLEYKNYVISVPLDIEDTELWFLENSGTFLPESRPKDDFSYSYEIFKKDDNYSYYNVIVVRRDYLNRLLEVLNFNEGKLIAVLPFPIAIAWNQLSSGKTVLYLHLLNNLLIYSLITDERQYLCDVVYNDYIENGAINIAIISSQLADIKTNLIPLLQEKSDDNSNMSHLSIILNTREDQFKSVETVVKQIFNNSVINQDFSAAYPYLTGSLLGLNLIFNDVDSGLNLIKSHFQNDIRFHIEKQLTIRIALIVGAILIALLFILFIAENWLSGMLNEMEEGEINLTSRIVQVENLKKENLYLKTNLNLIGTLKENRAKYTVLMYDITRIVTDRSCLTSINFKSIDNSIITCEIAGISQSQEEVARIIGNMESIKAFKNVVLTYAGISENLNSYEKENDGKNKMIHFNISARYNADSK
ncbi:MAG: hypothetical protein Q8940_14705 [Bacteroidota bacterium]|nr:hypothetical protein [Bacteroidota bacterium]